MLLNAYLHLEKADSWQRPFSAWMREVRCGGVGVGLRPPLRHPYLAGSREKLDE